MSLYTVRVTLPRTIELIVNAGSKAVAEQAAWEFVTTAFSEALRLWDEREPITDRNGRKVGEVYIELPGDEFIELAPDAIEITGRAIE